MFNHKSFSLLFSFLFLIINCNAQQDDNVSKYFEDGGISNSKNIAKIYVLSAITGDLAFGYERLISDRVAIEGSVGFLLPYVIDPIPLTFKNDDVIQSRSTGSSMSLQIKLYPFDNVDNWYQGIQYTNRSFTINENDIRQHLIVFNGGYQIRIEKHFLLDFAVGLGFKVDKKVSGEFDPLEDEDNTELIVPLSFNIGYLF